MQNSSIKGQRYLTADIQRQTEQEKKREAFLAEVEEIVSHARSPESSESKETEEQ